MSSETFKERRRVDPDIHDTHDRVIRLEVQIAALGTQLKNYSDQIEARIATVHRMVWAVITGMGSLLVAVIVAAVAKVGVF